MTFLEWSRPQVAMVPTSEFDDAGGFMVGGSRDPERLKESAICDMRHVHIWHFFVCCMTFVQHSWHGEDL